MIATEERHCPHAAFCVHACDDDECFLETLEQPNGPEQPLTRAECEGFLRMIDEHERGLV